MNDFLSVDGSGHHPQIACRKRQLGRWRTLGAVGILGISLVAAAAPAAAQFEDPPILKASEILEPSLLKSPLHEVAEEVTTYGFANGYMLKSRYGTEGVQGDAVLRLRVYELKVLAEIDKIKKSDEFAEALVRAAKSPLLATKHLITNPVDTISGVPRGAWRVLNRAGEAIRGKAAPGEFEDSRIESLIGFSQVKRQLAFRLKVDPYTSNKQLQSELNSLAWASYAGKMTVSAALTAGAGTAVAAVQGLKTAEDFAVLIRDSTPADLQQANSKKLKAAGVSAAGAEAFLNNPWYSPTTQSGLVALLDEIGAVAGRDLYVRLCAAAEGEEDALFYLQTARLINRYQSKVAQVVEISQFSGIPVFADAGGVLVVPFYWDHGAWTERGAAAVDALQGFSIGGKPATGVHIFMSGTMTDLARKELAARKITLTEDAFAQTAPAGRN